MTKIVKTFKDVNLAVLQGDLDDVKAWYANKIISRDVLKAANEALKSASAEATEFREWLADEVFVPADRSPKGGEVRRYKAQVNKVPTDEGEPERFTDPYVKVPVNTLGVTERKTEVFAAFRGEYVVIAKSAEQARALATCLESFGPPVVVGTPEATQAPAAAE